MLLSTYCPASTCPWHHPLIARALATTCSWSKGAIVGSKVIQWNTSTCKGETNGIRYPRNVCQIMTHLPKNQIFLHSVCFERFARIRVQGFITVLSEAFESLQPLTQIPGFDGWVRWQGHEKQTHMDNNVWSATCPISKLYRLIKIFWFLIFFYRLIKFEVKYNEITKLLSIYKKNLKKTQNFYRLIKFLFNHLWQSHVVIPFRLFQGCGHVCYRSPSKRLAAKETCRETRRSK